VIVDDVRLTPVTETFGVPETEVTLVVTEPGVRKFHPPGAVRISVTPVPAVKSVFTPSTMSIVPRVDH
jgi:hypothetical protein